MCSQVYKLICSRPNDILMQSLVLINSSDASPWFFNDSSIPMGPNLNTNVSRPHLSQQCWWACSVRAEGPTLPKLWTDRSMPFPATKVIKIFVLFADIGNLYPPQSEKVSGYLGHPLDCANGDDQNHPKVSSQWSYQREQGWDEQTSTKNLLRSKYAR